MAQTITGSEKQVQWAGQIRQSWLLAEAKMHEVVDRQAGTDEAKQAAHANIDRAMQVIRTQTSASWLIGHRPATLTYRADEVTVMDHLAALRGILREMR